MNRINMNPPFYFNLKIGKPTVLCFSLFLFFSIHPAIAQRDTIALNTNWQFKTDKQSEGVKTAWYAGVLTNARAVQIPHTWNIEDSNQTHYGWAWYQRMLDIPANYKNKQVVLEFGAVNHTAFIYLNGSKVAEHIGDGFNKFKVDISKLIS